MLFCICKRKTVTFLQSSQSSKGHFFWFQKRNSYIFDVIYWIFGRSEVISIEWIAKTNNCFKNRKTLDQDSTLFSVNSSKNLWCKVRFLQVFRCVSQCMSDKSSKNRNFFRKLKKDEKISEGRICYCLVFLKENHILSCIFKGKSITVLYIMQGKSSTILHLQRKIC